MAESKTATKASLAKAVNSWVADECKRLEVKSIGYGGYKADSVLEFKEHGDRIHVVMTDHRKFVVPA